MTNLYYTPTTFTKNTKARAEDVTAMSTALEASFGKVPAQLDLERSRTTYAADTGAANAYVVTLLYPWVAYQEGASLVVKITTANTGASTINVDGLGVKTIKRPDGSDLVADDLPAGAMVPLSYDGTNFMLSSMSAAAAASATAAAASAAAAAVSETNAATSETNAATSETNAAASAASINMPSAVADSFIRMNAGATAFENKTAAQVLTALSAGLDSISGLTTAADKMIYSTALNTYAITGLTAAGRAILDDANAAAQRTTLGLVIGTNVQAWDTQLDDIAALAVTDGNIIVGDGANWVAESGATARTSLGALGNIVEDLTPQLGGDLALNGKSIDFPTTPNISDCLDEDTMASDSATMLATQQSIKAYVDAASGITLATEQASTSGTSLDFTSIPSGTKRITIMFDGVSTTGASDIIVQLGDAGGPETSGYTGVNVDSSQASGVANGAGFILNNAQAAGDLIVGSMTLTLEDSATFTWAATSIVSDDGSTNVSYGSGTKALSAELDRVRITTAGGSETFDAGAINITYE